MKGYFVIIVSIATLTLMGVLLYYSGGIETRTEKVEKVEDVESVESDKIETNIDNTASSEDIPLKNWQDRITKKPFGVLIDPLTSPVQPEKFSGYHTGTDFEVLDDESSVKVEVRAICSGDFIESRYASGYGGVLIQSCKINNTDVLVLYGHIDISSLKTRSSSGRIEKSEVISVLADSGSYYSGGERKHLHLGILGSKSIDYKGYVESESLLSGWLDFEKQDL